MTVIPVVDAARVPDLYSARVPSPEAGQRSQSDTFGLALEQVLVKVTGHRGIVADPLVMNQFASAQAYVEQHRVNPDGSTWVLFDQVALRRVLDSVGQPVWGEERPATLAWMVLDYGDVILHVFHEDKRENYALEDLWSDAPRVPFETVAERMGKAQL